MKEPPKLIKRQDCNDGMWRNFASTTWDWVKHKLHAMSQQFDWSLVPQLIDNLTGIAQVGLTAAQMAKSVSEPKYCGGQTQWVNVFRQADNKEVTFFIGVSAWTTGINCDTTAQTEAIAFGIDEAIIKAQDLNAISWCSRLHHEGTWRCDVRLIRWEDVAQCGQNIWDLACGGTWDGSHDEL